MSDFGFSVNRLSGQKILGQFWRPGDDRSVRTDQNGPLDQPGMLGHGLNQALWIGLLQPQFAVFRLFFAHHLARVRERLERLLQLAKACGLVCRREKMCLV